MSRWAAKTDASHEDLLQALRDLGWQVLSTHRLSNFVDAVGYRPSHGVTLFEFKQTKGKLTESQQRLKDLGWPVKILRSADDAIAFTRTR